MFYRVIFFTCILILNACSPAEQAPVKLYSQLAPASEKAVNDARVQPFTELYNGITKKSVAELTRNTYAEKLFFNDTFATIRQREELIAYLQSTAEQVDKLELSILDVTAIDQNDKDLIIRWIMVTHLSILGSEKKINSVGMTHLHLNNDGKIVMHQDFWDSMQGFYQHIPLLGGFLRWIQNQVHS